MTRIDRRRLLKFAGAATLAASTGGIAGILASARAPAYGQMTSLQWFKFVDFVPVSDQLLRGKITEECQKALGIKLNIETIEGNGIQPRITFLDEPLKQNLLGRLADMPEGDRLYHGDFHPINGPISTRTAISQDAARKHTRLAALRRGGQTGRGRP